MVNLLYLHISEHCNTHSLEPTEQGRSSARHPTLATRPSHYRLKQLGCISFTPTYAWAAFDTKPSHDVFIANGRFLERGLIEMARTNDRSSSNSSRWQPAGRQISNFRFERPLFKMQADSPRPLRDGQGIVFEGPLNIQELTLIEFSWHCLVVAGHRSLHPVLRSTSHLET